MRVSFAEARGPERWALLLRQLGLAEILVATLDLTAAQALLTALSSAPATASGGTAYHRRSATSCLLRAIFSTIYLPGRSGEPRGNNNCKATLARIRLTLIARGRSGLVMISRLVRAILILPGTMLVVVPALILWLSRDTALAARPAGIEDPRSWIGGLLFSVGLVLAIWTCRLFLTVGEGTPAPWDPPSKLVVDGPYRHVRNPMITSVLLMLAGEAVFLRSWGLAGWLLLFYLANALYFPLSEEKALERRFGDQYRLYKANVPRWVPRLRPWNQP